jgi:hypothetical protein
MRDICLARLFHLEGKKDANEARAEKRYVSDDVLLKVILRLNMMY